MTALALVLDVLVALAGGVAAFGLTLTAFARARHTRPYDLLRDAPLPPALPPDAGRWGNAGRPSTPVVTASRAGPNHRTDAAPQHTKGTR